jgi:hypothetical protein
VTPGATDEQVIDAALDLLLAVQEKRRASVPPRVKREVRGRDEGKCTWPLANGATCDSAVRLQVDHVVPRGKGGPSTVANCRILCQAHNLEAARQAYGDAHMDLFTRRVPTAEEPVAPYAARRPAARHLRSSPEVKETARPSAPRPWRTSSRSGAFAPLRPEAISEAVHDPPADSKRLTVATRSGSFFGHGSPAGAEATGSAAIGSGTCSSLVAVPPGFWNSGRSQRTRPRRSSSARSEPLAPAHLVMNSWPCIQEPSYLPGWTWRGTRSWERCAPSTS